MDWMVGVDYTYAPLTFGIAYVDTDITKKESAYLLPNFSSTKDGSSIAGGQGIILGDRSILMRSGAR